MAVIDTLMNWLRRLFDRLRYPGKSVQYELRRMTPKGGWTNFYADPNYDHATAFPTPPPQPRFGSDTGYPPGKYQCVRRVDGRIKSTLWTVESSNVDEYYAEWRAKLADAEPDTDTTATDGGSAAESGAGDATEAASATAESDTDDEPSQFEQELIADVKQGSKLSLLALGVHEFFADRDASDDGDDDTPDAADEDL